MTYVSGFVIPVKTADRDAYLECARTAAPIFKEFGALSIVENWGDKLPDGKVTDFKMAVKAEPDETVVFSYILYKSRKDRDRINKKVMADPRMAKMMDPKSPPFDSKRMIFGGFKTIVDL